MDYKMLYRERPYDQSSQDVEWTMCKTRTGWSRRIDLYERLGTFKVCNLPVSQVVDVIRSFRMELPTSYLSTIPMATLGAAGFIIVCHDGGCKNVAPPAHAFSQCTNVSVSMLCPSFRFSLPTIYLPQDCISVHLKDSEKANPTLKSV